MRIYPVGDGDRLMLLACEIIRLNAAGGASRFIRLIEHHVEQEAFVNKVG